MYGEQGTIGLIVPSNNTVVEREFNRWAGDHFGVVAARMFNTQTTPEQLALMREGSVQAAELLSTAHPSVVAFACTSGSFVGGVEYESELRVGIAEAAGASAITTSQAFISAFEKLGVKRVAVATPYPDDINEFERQFIEAKGFEVTSLAGLGINESYQIGRCTADQAADIARQVNDDNADAVFISCTNFATAPILQQLEQELNKPVISSNLATFWYAARTLSGGTDNYGIAGKLMTI